MEANHINQINDAQLLRNSLYLNHPFKISFKSAQIAHPMLTNLTCERQKRKILLQTTNISRNHAQSSCSKEEDLLRISSLQNEWVNLKNSFDSNKNTSSDTFKHQHFNQSHSSLKCALDSMHREDFTIKNEQHIQLAKEFIICPNSIQTRNNTITNKALHIKANQENIQTSEYFKSEFKQIARNKHKLADATNLRQSVSHAQIRSVFSIKKEDSQLTCHSLLLSRARGHSLQPNQ